MFIFYLFICLFIYYIFMLICFSAVKVDLFSEGSQNRIVSLVAISLKSSRTYFNLFVQILLYINLQNLFVVFNSCLSAFFKKKNKKNKHFLLLKFMSLQYLVFENWSYTGIDCHRLGLFGHKTGFIVKRHF